MKRAIGYLMLLSLSLFLISGCSADGAEAGAPAATGMDPAATAEGQAGGTAVYGRVESIVGNEVILALGEAEGMESMPDRGGDMPTGEMPKMSGDMPSGDRPTMGSGEMPTGERPAMGSGEMPTGEMPDMSGGEMPSGSWGGGEGGRSNSASGEGSAQGANVELTYTGETATYLIPVGLTVGTGDFSSISEGMVLRLAFSENGAITAVSIISR